MENVPKNNINQQVNKSNTKLTCFNYDSVYKNNLSQSDFLYRVIKQMFLSNMFLVILSSFTFNCLPTSYEIYTSWLGLATFGDSDKSWLWLLILGDTSLLGLAILRGTSSLGLVILVDKIGCILSALRGLSWLGLDTWWGSSIFCLMGALCGSPWLGLNIWGHEPAA